MSFRGYNPVSDPPHWPHQKKAFELSGDREYFFLSMEQRTGKTRVVLDTAGYLFEQKLITGMVVVSMPDAAPRNWLDEVNLWLPQRINRLVHLWRPNKFKNKSFQETLVKLLNAPADTLSIISIQGESIATDNFINWIGKFLRKRPTLLVGDETTLIMKTPGIQRTKVMNSMGKLAAYRRCLDGTPTGNGPLDLFTQYRFLSPDILGYSNFFTFKNRYAVLEKSFNHSQGHEFTVVKRDQAGNPMYQNLDELQRKIAPHTFRVLRADVFPNAPKPVFQKHYFALTDQQRSKYDKLMEEYELELKALGTISVAHVLTRYTRLQQLSSGYYPASRAAVVCEACEGNGCETCEMLGVVEKDVPMERFVSFEKNPRVLALKHELERSPWPVVVWAKFNEDIDNVMELARQLNRKPVQYDGRISSEQKYLNMRGFQGGEFDTFVGKTTSAGRAARLTAARSMIYYTNQFGLIGRLQSQDRTEFGERDFATDVIDLVAEDTIDEKMIRAFRTGRELSDVILGENSGKWI